MSEKEVWTVDYMDCRFGWSEREGDILELTELLFRFHPARPHHPEEPASLSISLSGEKKRGFENIPGEEWEAYTPDSLTLVQAERLWRFLGACLGKMTLDTPAVLK